MSNLATHDYDDHDRDVMAAPGHQPPGVELALTPDPVEIRRSAGVSALLGVAAAGVAIAWLARAVVTGSALDWSFMAFTMVISAVWLTWFIDSRTPLLVADAFGIRMRLGKEWRGLTWRAIHSVQVTPRRGWLRDGRVVIEAHNQETLLAELGAGARRQATLSQWLYGAPLALPLGLLTKVHGGSGELAQALGELSAGSTQVQVVRRTEPEAGPSPDEDPATPNGLAQTNVELPATAAGAALVLEDRVVPSATPEPTRPIRTAARADIHHLRPESSDVVVPAAKDDDQDDQQPLAETALPASPGQPSDSWLSRVRPIAREGHPVEELVIDDYAAEPAADPVIGPVLRAARTRLGLDVDSLAQRTRIRPHVIEAIEVDDFVPCGGDFYARGHLRTLCRILGIDATGVMTDYDERYAHAPLDPRRVFEAELATGAYGSIRSTRGGPNWSILLAAVMAVILLWSVARLVMDQPPALPQNTPVLNGSGGPNAAVATIADPIKVTIKTQNVGAQVVVRDAAGKVVFRGPLAMGETQEVKASPPVRVQASDGSVTVALAGRPPQPVGDAGEAGQRTYAGR